MRLGDARRWACVSTGAIGGRNMCGDWRIGRLHYIWDYERLGSNADHGARHLSPLLAGQKRNGDR